MKRNRKATYFRSRGEQLELRNLLAGHGFAGAFDHALHDAALASAFNHAGAQFARAAPFAQLAARNFAFGQLGSSNAENAPKLAVTLSDDTGLSAKVSYRTYTEDGVSENELKVVVTGAPASTPLNVLVGTTSIGTVDIDANGAGTAIFSTNPGTDEKELPADLAIAAGTNVTVGTLNGDLAATNTGGHYCGGGGENGGNENSTVSRFRARLTDPDNADASARVVLQTHTVTETADDDTQTTTTVTRLAVKVTGAAASSELPVMVGTTLVGTVSTDENGDAKVVFSTNPTGNQQAFTNVPTGVDDTTVVTIGTLTGTFERANYGHGHFGFGRFRGR